MSIIPLAIAAIFLSIAFSNKRSADAKAKNWITVKGKVLEMKTYWTTRRHYAPFVTFYTAENHQLFLNGKGSQNILYQPGQLIEVVYNPQNPNQSEIKYDSGDTEMRRTRFMFGGFFLCGGLLFFLIDMVILFAGIMTLLGVK